MPDPKTSAEIFGDAGNDASGLFQGRKSAQNALKRGGNIYDALLGGLSVPELLAMMNSMEAQSYASPESLAAVNQALQGQQRLASSPNISPAERNLLAQIEQQQLQTARGGREALLANAAARGQLGGGAALTALLQGQGQAAGQARMQGLGAADMANNRYLNALQQLGALGGQQRAQSFMESSSRGAAEDARQRYNNALKAQQLGLEQGLAGQQSGFLQDLSNQQFQSEQARRQRIGGFLGGMIQSGIGLGSSMYNPTKALGGISGVSGGVTRGGVPYVEDTRNDPRYY